jgi:DNA adenine methylase
MQCGRCNCQFVITWQFMTVITAEPFLRWAGSKRKSVRILKTYWNAGNGTYIEPFAGSASLFFHVAPPRAVLSDVNAELIKTFRSVRQDPDAVFASLRCRPIRPDYFNTLRKQNPRRLPPSTRAARFIYLNRFCFNGLYRTNLNGIFNVPFSGEKTGKKPSKEHLSNCSKLLRNALLYHGDFEAVVRKYAAKDDFVYLDPPYATSARRIFREYHPATFTVDDLARLAQLLKEIAARGATFVLSYAYCPEALELFSDWSRTRFFVQRNIAGFTGDRRVAAELLVTNAE